RRSREPAGTPVTPVRYRRATEAGRNRRIADEDAPPVTCLSWAESSQRQREELADSANGDRRPAAGSGKKRPRGRERQARPPRPRISRTRRARVRSRRRVASVVKGPTVRSSLLIRYRRVL